jgi:hypothetical protein
MKGCVIHCVIFIQDMNDNVIQHPQGKKIPEVKELIIFHRNIRLKSVTLLNSVCLYMLTQQPNSHFKTAEVQVDNSKSR